MANRKKVAADARKEANKTKFGAVLNSNPTSPRKTRLVVDLIRGKKVEEALTILKFHKKESAGKLGMDYRLCFKNNEACNSCNKRQ